MRFESRSALRIKIRIRIRIRIKTKKKIKKMIRIRTKIRIRLRIKISFRLTITDGFRIGIASGVTGFEGFCMEPRVTAHRARMGGVHNWHIIEGFCMEPRMAAGADPIPDLDRAQG